jgi:predicted nucleic acid-binding protein
MDYVFDTSSVIVLLEICQLRRELRAFSSKNGLYIPNKVREEFLEGCKIERDAINVFTVLPPTVDNDLLPYFTKNADSGEFWAISHAKNEKNCVCVMDEGFGRNMCDFLNVRHVGTIAIINEMKVQGFLSKGDLANIRERIANSNFYLSKRLLSKLEEICQSNFTQQNLSSKEHGPNIRSPQKT